jgi:hypothetical protein
MDGSICLGGAGGVFRILLKKASRDFAVKVTRRVSMW